jgi:Retron-type reverse transcriptase
VKRYGFIYEKVCDTENIKLAMQKASLGKRNQKRVKKVLDNADSYAGKLQQMLKAKTYQPSTPQIRVINDGTSGKERTIYKPNFYPDQIIHWALMLQLEPMIMHGMYEYSCGSIPERGTSYAQKSLRKWIDNDRRNTKYCLKMDIHKFYPSIDNDLLKQRFRQLIKDSDCLWLIDQIIDQNKGQPIGFYTSQWFANFFLQDLDHFIKEQLGVKYYVRYVDDLVMLCSNKKKLHRTQQAVSEYLTGIKLQIKSNWQVFRLDCRDIDFLGIRFYRDKSTLRKRNSLRIRRRVSKIQKKGYLNYSDACAVISHWGWLKRTDSYQFYHCIVQPVARIKIARKVVSVNVRYYPKRNFTAKLS